MKIAINDNRLYWVAAAVVVVFLAYIVWAHQQPVAYVRDHKVEPYSEGEVIHVTPTESPCSLERVQLACDRWGASPGCPRCVAQPTGGSMRLVVYSGAHSGAYAADGTIGLHPDRCGTQDAALEHELSHALDIKHTSRKGDVTNPIPERMGFNFPACVEQLD